MENYIDNLVINHPHTKELHKQPYQMCSISVMDTSDPLITFNEFGVCNHVTSYNNWANFKKPNKAEAADLLQKMVMMLKEEGKGKDYDCIMGLSGGVDSSYLAYLATQVFGLRPLIVHVDTGWNSELAVSNIQNMVQKLKLDLHTLVIDWDEIKDLQLSFFKSSIANLDAPQDHAFIASLFQEAKKYNIKYILNGGNMATESILPTTWGYSASDAVILQAIHKKYGTGKLKTYPFYTGFKKRIYYPYIKRMKTLRPLELIDYNKEEAKSLLIEKFGWRDYGGKHYESKFTKFFQAHYLPQKFGYDKRKAHLSSLIVSGQISREMAIEDLKKPLYQTYDLEEDKIYFIKKLGITLSEYEEIMALPPSFYTDFHNNEQFEKTYNIFINKIIKFLKWIKIR
jgi:N-acetyl sugar amidotransferase